MTGKSLIKSNLPNLIDRIQPSQTTVLILTAILIGLGTGLGAVIFIRLIEFVMRTLFAGGVFAPALFAGASLGGAFGQLVERFAPGLTAGPGAFATVGMAAVFAGAARAPFTAILIVFDMTDDYRLIVPLMAGVIVSLILAERLQKESIYTLKPTRRGIHLQRGRDIDVMDAVRVEEIMMTPPGAVHEDMPVSALANEFIHTGRHGFPIIDHDGNLSGMVTALCECDSVEAIKTILNNQE